MSQQESFTLFCDAVTIEPPKLGKQLCLCITNADLDFLSEELPINQIIQELGIAYILESIGRAKCLLHFEVQDLAEPLNQVYTGTEE